MSAGAEHPIVAAEVSKWFGDVVAVSEVSFSIGAGVTALLGPNGAGKSTVLRMMAGLTAPSRGAVRILGQDPRADPALSRRIGLVPQQEALFDDVDALGFVRLAGVLHGLTDPASAASAALGAVGMDPTDPRPLRTYSKGMRQRVKIAQAIVHEPEVLILDEPLTGLDPRQRIAMVALIRALGASGACVVVSSHVLEEVERFGSRVLVMAQGRLAAEGDFHAIRDLMDDRPHRVRIRTDRPRRLAGWLLAEGAVIAARVDGDDAVVVDTDRVHELRRSLPVVAAKLEARLLEVLPLDEDLDSVFRYLVGRP